MYLQRRVIKHPALATWALRFATQRDLKMVLRGLSEVPHDLELARCGAAAELNGRAPH